MKTFGRAFEICRCLFLACIRLAIQLTGNFFSRKRRGWQSIVGSGLVDLFTALGPTYLKLGQILSTRRDLVSPLIIHELERLQDRLPPVPFDIVPKLFQEELGIKMEDAFSKMNERPIASASISSVFRGRLRDGRAVAVKVRRPGVERQIQLDMRLLRLVTGWLALLPPLRHVPMRTVLGEFGDCLERQLDFRKEAEANRRLRHAFASEPRILIPRLVDCLCSSSILTMDFMHEITVRSSPLRKVSQRKSLLVALRALYYMIFVEGFIHCDLHQGNLHLLRGGRIAMIDFGFVSEFKDFDRQVFAEFFYSVSENHGARCAELIVETASYVPPQLCYAEFEREICAQIDDISRTTAGKFHVADFVVRIFDTQRRHRIVGTTASFMAIVSLLVLEGVTRHIYPDLDFQREALTFILPIILSPPRRNKATNSGSGTLSEGLRVLGVVRVN